MSKAFKVIGAAIAIIFVLFIILCFIFAYGVDPNKYKSRIETYSYDKTGRHLVINGNISWSFFPTFGLHVKDVIIGNPPNVKGPDFAHIGKLSVKVKTLSLIGGSIKVREIDVEDATINLITDANNHRNWLGWSADSQTPSHPSKTQHISQTQATPKDSNRDTIFVDSLHIKNSAVHLTDHQTKTTWNFTKVNITANGFHSEKEFPLTLTFHFNHSQSNEVLTTKLESMVSINPATHEVTMSNTGVNSILFRPNHAEIPIHATGKIDLNPTKETLSFDPVNLQIANMKIKGKAHVKKLFSIPTVSLTLISEGTALQPFIKDISNRDFISGNLNYSTTLHGRGDSSSQFMDSLNGKGNLTITNGSIKGLDLLQFLNRAESLLGLQQTTNGSSTSQQTDFLKLSASYVIKKGMLTNDDLKLVGKSISARGKGQVDLAHKSFNYSLLAKLNTYSQQHAKSFELPIRMTGTYHHPVITPDFSAIAGGVVRDEIKNKLKGFFR